MLFKSYIGSCLPSGERLHVVEVNVQWWRYTRVIQHRAKHNGKTRNENTMRSTAKSREWIYARAPARASKMANQCVNTAVTLILYLRKKAVLRKTPCFKSRDCSAVAIHRSFWPIQYGLEKSNQTHIHTHNYCNPAAHAHQGSITTVSYISTTTPRPLHIQLPLQTTITQCKLPETSAVFVPVAGWKAPPAQVATGDNHHLCKWNGCTIWMRNTTSTRCKGLNTRHKGQGQH